MPRHHDLLALTVLALLSERSRHPYDVQRLIRLRHTQFAMDKARGMYHAVDRLVASGLIEPLETSREGRRPERTVYRITELGREELESWLQDLLENPAPDRGSFTAAISFLSYLPEGTGYEALQARTVALEAEIAALDASLRVLQSNLELPRLFVLEHEYTRTMRSAELAWVRSLLEDIAAGRLTWDPETLRALVTTFHEKRGERYA